MSLACLAPIVPLASGVPLPMSHDLNISEQSSASFPEHDAHPRQFRAGEPRLADDQDPFFVFDFHAIDGPSERSGDAVRHDDRRWSNYWDVERLCRGPEPVPDWVVTDRAAIDTDLGVLKTGKEEHRAFQRSDTYTEGRRTRNSRDTRAMAKKTQHGRAVASGQWAGAEWESLKRFWSAGIPVPYPVQIDGAEILMEFIAVDLHGVGHRDPRGPESLERLPFRPSPLT